MQKRRSLAVQSLIFFDIFRCRIDRKRSWVNLSRDMGHYVWGLVGTEAICLTFSLAYDIFAVKGSLSDSISC
jgi:hypothetical protein